MFFLIFKHFTIIGFVKKVFICHIHNYTEYNQQWNMFSAFNPSKCTHTWSSGQPTMRRLGSCWGFGALLKGLTSVMNNSCRSRGSNLQPRVTSPMIYPLGHSYNIGFTNKMPPSCSCFENCAQDRHCSASEGRRDSNNGDVHRYLICCS